MFGTAAGLPGRIVSGTAAGLLNGLSMTVFCYICRGRLAGSESMRACSEAVETAYRSETGEYTGTVTAGVLLIEEI